MHVSPYYFWKMFKKTTGVTFTDYLGRVRIEKAKNLLLNPHLRVSEIAYEIGFQSLNAMSSPVDQIKHPFLEDLPAPYLRFLTDAASLRRFTSREIIFAEGDEAELFYLIIEGQVTLESFVPGWGTLAVQTLGAGDALGWSWLFPPYRWRFGARAIDGAETLALDARRLRDLADKEPAFGVELLKRIARIVIDRLHATRLQLVARLPGLT